MASEVDDARNSEGEFKNIVYAEGKIKRRINPPEKLIEFKVVNFYPENIGHCSCGKSLKHLRVKNRADICPDFFNHDRFLFENKNLWINGDIHPIRQMQNMAFQRNLAFGHF